MVINRRTFAGTSLRSVCFALALLAQAATAAAQESLRISPFVRDNQVLVSFTLNDAYNDAVHEAIASGLKTTFTYELELRTIDGRIEEVTVTENEAAVKAWLTEWTRVQMCDTSRLDATRDYYVRIT